MAERRKSMSKRDKELLQHYEPEFAAASESAWDRLLNKYGVASFFKKKHEDDNLSSKSDE